MIYEFNLLVIKIISILIFSGLLSLLLVPIYLRIAQRLKLSDTFVSKERLIQAPIASTTLQEKADTPTMGGVIIWLPPIILALFFYLLKNFFGGYFDFLNFLTRNETYLPIFGLFLGGIIGLIDDILNKFKKGHKFGAKEKLLIYLGIAIFFAWWFTVKLNYRFVEIVDFRFFIPFPIFFIIFVFVFLATSLSFNEIDGLDGLFAGVAISILIFLLFVSLVEAKYNLASFISALLGSLTVYLWFNSYPALFFDGNNGSFSVGTSIALMSFLTSTYLLLPLIGLSLVIESGSVILQQISKRLFKRKIFLSTPIHHHFKAKGMKEPKIVIRFWIINFLGVLLGLIFYFVIKGLK